MSLNKKQKKVWTVLVVISSLALILGTLLPFLPYFSL